MISPRLTEAGIRAVPTEGIGRRTTAHLNLTRSLADVWGLSQPDLDQVRADLAPKPAYQPPVPREIPIVTVVRKVPFAGADRTDRW